MKQLNGVVRWIRGRVAILELEFLFWNLNFDRQTCEGHVLEQNACMLEETLMYIVLRERGCAEAEKDSEKSGARARACVRVRLCETGQGRGRVDT